MTAKYPPPPLASEPLYRNAVRFDTPKLPAPAPQPSLVDGAWKRHLRARFLLEEPPADSGSPPPATPE